MNDNTIDSEQPRGGEFRRYRQGLAAIYLVVAGLGVALLVASVLAGLFFTHEAEAATSADARECERDLTLALERMRSQIPVRVAATLQEGASDRLPGPDVLLTSTAQLVTRCKQVANSPANHAIREAADALAELERGFRHTLSQFEHDVAAHGARVDTALTSARALLGQEAKSP